MYIYIYIHNTHTYIYIYIYIPYLGAPFRILSNSPRVWVVCVRWGFLFCSANRTYVLIGVLPDTRNQGETLCLGRVQKFHPRGHLWRFSDAGVRNKIEPPRWKYTRQLNKIRHITTHKQKTTNMTSTRTRKTKNPPDRSLRRRLSSKACAVRP